MWKIYGTLEFFWGHNKNSQQLRCQSTIGQNKMKSNNIIPRPSTTQNKDAVNMLWDFVASLDFLNSLWVTMPASESSSHPISTTITVNKSIHDLVIPNQRSNCNTLLHLSQHLVIINRSDAFLQSCEQFWAKGRTLG